MNTSISTFLWPDAPPPYPKDALIKKKARRTCCVCHQAHPSGPAISAIRFATRPIVRVGPRLIQSPHRTYWLALCDCRERQAHAVCVATLLTRDEEECFACRYDYDLRRRRRFVLFLAVLAVLFSLGSAIGLMFGLATLGQILDEVALGSDIGAKLDGDENWQDHEMYAIAAWLNMVHLVTGFAGEALLGLVYVFGVCGIIGLRRTIRMIHTAHYLEMRTDWQKCIDKGSVAWRCAVMLALAIFALVFGTYLLFYSWVWAPLLHLLCRRVLRVTTTASSPSVASIPPLAAQY